MGMMSLRKLYRKEDKMAITNAENLLDFWFSEEIMPRIFTEDPWLDEKLRKEYYDT